MSELGKPPFGETLRYFRERKALSRKKLGEKVGKHRNAIYLWERGDYLPDRGLVEALITALELNEEDMYLFLEARFGSASILPMYNFPFERNVYFTGREEILRLLHLYLSDGKQVA